MMQKRDDLQIKRDFRLRQSRQLLAIAVALLGMVILALVYKRHDLFGEFPKSTIFGSQLVVIALFAGFTAVNWRCPSCKKYLGHDINRRICKKCGVRLQ
jgi:hypothetical protein